jgi:hypothetical protein
MTRGLVVCLRKEAECVLLIESVPTAFTSN